MAEAIIGGLVKTGTVPSSNIYVSDVSQARIDSLSEKYGVQNFGANEARSNQKVAEKCEILVIAVKP